MGKGEGGEAGDEEGKARQKDKIRQVLKIFE